MLLEAIYRKLVVKGSDGLVHALYQRVRTDGVAGSAFLRVEGQVWTWCELADQAVAS